MVELTKSPIPNSSSISASMRAWSYTGEGRGHYVKNRPNSEKSPKLDNNL